MASTINSFVDLSGQTETITMMDLRTKPGDVLLQASLGKVFAITKAGKKVATLGPYEPNALELGAAVRRGQR